METRPTTAHRLRAQLLDRPARDVAAVLDRLFAVQAQDFHAARWALGVRCANATLETIDAAFDSGRVVRSWPMRGTLHAVAAEDVGWLTRFFSERNRSRRTAYHRELGFDDAQVNKARRIVERALGAGPLARAGLMAALTRGGVSVAGQRGIHLVWVLAQLGVLCLGPVLEGEHAFVLLDAWVKRGRRLAGDEALGELATRYFAGHGPATMHDLAWWTGLSQRDSARAMEIAGVKNAKGAVKVKSPPLLLPAFDEYFLGYANRDAVLEPKWFDRVVPGGNGVFQPLLVLDGRVVGTWKRRVGQREVSVELFPFTPLPARSVEALHGAAEDFARFHGKPVRVAVQRGATASARARPSSGSTASSRAQRSR